MRCDVVSAEPLRACPMVCVRRSTFGVEGVHRCPWQMSSHSVRSSLGARSGVKPRAGVCAAGGQRAVDAGFLDDLMARVDEDRLALTGQGGCLPELVKPVLELGLVEELTGHRATPRATRSAAAVRTPATAPSRRRWPASSVGPPPRPDHSRLQPLGDDLARQCRDQR
jgi:hypothetical protein